MAARDNLSSQFWGPGGKMFHISPMENREGIEKEGLKANTPPPNPLGKSFKSETPGVFVAAQPYSFDNNMDVYVVDTSNLPAIKDDAFAIDRAADARFVPGSIPPDRVTRLKGKDYKKAQDAVRNRNVYPWDNPFA